MEVSIVPTIILSVLLLIFLISGVPIAFVLCFVGSGLRGMGRYWVNGSDNAGILWHLFF